jgi:hypothetical protein
MQLTFRRAALSWLDSAANNRGKFNPNAVNPPIRKKPRRSTPPHVLAVVVPNANI